MGVGLSDASCVSKRRRRVANAVEKERLSTSVDSNCLKMPVVMPLVVLCAVTREIDQPACELDSSWLANGTTAATSRRFVELESKSLDVGFPLDGFGGPCVTVALQ